MYHSNSKKNAPRIGNTSSLESFIKKVYNHLISSQDAALRCMDSDSVIISPKKDEIIFSKESNLEIDIGIPRNNERLS